MQNKKEAKRVMPNCDFFPKNCRGSHVGMILSFVVFISCLIFIYTILEPVVNTQKSKQNLITNLEIELTEKFSNNLITAIIANDSNPDIYDCIRINNTELNTSGLNAIAKNNLGEIKNSSINGSYLFLDWSDNETYFKIYYSEEEFEEYNLTRACNPTNNYYQGLITWKKQVFVSRVRETAREYEINYDSLKSELKVPLDSDFSFRFTLSNGTEIKTKEINISKDVYVQEFPIQYLDERADIKFGSLTIRAW